MTSSPPRHDRRALPTRPVRHVAFDVARAFLVTPPPEDDDSSVHCDAYCTVLGKSMLKVKDEQYETLQRIESLETRSLQASEQAWRKPSSSPSVRENSFYEFVDERIQGLPIDEIVDQGRTVVAKVEEMVEEMERRFESVYEKLEGLDTQMEEFDQDMDKRFTAVDNRLNGLSTEFDEADVRLGAQIDETSKSLSQDLQDFELRMDVRFEAIRAMQWNALVSRPVDIVQPVPFVHRNEDGEWTKSQTPRRKLKWWWKLHEFRKRPQLIELLRHTGIGWRSWLEEVNTSSDSDSECSSSDEENLDNQYGPVSTLDDAVRRNQKAAVRALFAHMGLGYQRFEELFARDAQRLRGEQQPAKRSLDSPTSHEHANRRRTSQGELRGPSYWGSPTEVISRRSGPAGPNISTTSSTES